MEQHTFTSDTRIERSILASHHYGKHTTDQNAYISIKCNKGSESLRITVVMSDKIDNDHFKIRGEIEHRDFGRVPYFGIIQFNGADESLIDLTVDHPEFIRNYHKRIHPHYIED